MAVRRKPLLRLPELLCEMLRSGRWPRTREEANRQNLRCLARPEDIQRLAPDETEIFLNPRPFHTVRELSRTNRHWKSRQSDPTSIDFDLAIGIGDFGLGSDSPILLDYRANKDNPAIIRLKWSDAGKDNRWVHMSDNFPTFVDVLDL